MKWAVQNGVTTRALRRKAALLCEQLTTKSLWGPPNASYWGCRRERCDAQDALRMTLLFIALWTTSNKSTICSHQTHCIAGAVLDMIIILWSCDYIDRFFVAETISHLDRKFILQSWISKCISRYGICTFWHRKYIFCSIFNCICAGLWYRCAVACEKMKLNLNFVIKP